MDRYEGASIKDGVRNIRAKKLQKEKRNTTIELCQI